MFPLQINIVFKALGKHAEWDPTFFVKTHTLNISTNDAQELMPYKF
jgi:hypothetical protein